MRAAIYPLLIVNILLWIVFGLATLFGANPSLEQYPFYRNLLTIGAALVAIVLAFLGANLRRRKAFITYGLIALLIALFLVTFADDVGIIDLLVALPPLLTAALLIKERAHFL